MTVITGTAVAEPACPTFEFTVARVPAAVTLPAPVKLGEVYAKSPVIAIVLPVARAVAVSALPVVTSPVKAAVIVPAESFLSRLELRVYLQC